MHRGSLSSSGWQSLKDLDADGVNRFAAELLSSGRSARTVQKYITAVKSLSRWAVQSGRLAFDTLASVRRPSTQGEETITRRYLTHEEFVWLDSVTRMSGDSFGMTGVERAVLYAFAIQTGLRSSEIKAVTRAKLHLTAIQPFVLVPANSTKNAKPARQYLQRELADELRSMISKKLGGAQVFNMPPKYDVAEMFRQDLAAARLKWLGSIADSEQRIEADASDFLKAMDSEGQKLDFHSLRHTAATWLIQSGADVQTVQRIMRHADIKLTLQRYGHLFPGAEAEAVSRVRGAFLDRKLPEMLKATGTDHDSPKAQHQAQQSGRDVVRKGAKGDDVPNPLRIRKNPDQTEVEPGFSLARPTGLEPATSGSTVRCSNQLSYGPWRA